MSSSGTSSRNEVSIASVTVAFNAETTLPRQLEALLRQSRPLQEIVVVDNGSRDSTADLVARNFPTVTLLRLPQNLGMAGGWAAGLEYAAAQRHDWIWSFDDDSVPQFDALQQLLEGAKYVPDQLGILAPVAVHEESGLCYRPLLWSDGLHRISSEQIAQRPVLLVDLVITSGALVSREVVTRTGLPRADFFMDWFDFEYCLRARSAGFKVVVVRDAKLAHEIGRTRKIELYKYSRLWMDQAPWREYYMTRNLVYIAWSLRPNFRTKLFAFRHLARHACAVLIFGSRKRDVLANMSRGFRDGLRAKLGARVRPS